MLVFSGEKLRMARESARISCIHLAAAMCVDRQTVYKWQYGKTAPDINQALFIAHFLRVPLSALFEDIGAEEYQKIMDKKSRRYKRAGKIIGIIEAQSEKAAERLAKKKGVWKK